MKLRHERLRSDGAKTRSAVPEKPGSDDQTASLRYAPLGRPTKRPSGVGRFLPTASDSSRPLTAVHMRRRSDVQASAPPP